MKPVLILIISSKLLMTFIISCRHLAENPKKYGNHTTPISPGETLEEYFKRTKTYSDDVVLQALADVFLLNINVFKFISHDIKQTHFTAKSKVVSSTVSLFVGHLGEPQSYFSLRPVQWLTELPCSNYTHINFLFILFSLLKLCIFTDFANY